MTESTTQTSPAAAAPATPTEPAGFDAERRATELAILDALRAVVDPEIGMNVVELALIKQILLGPTLPGGLSNPNLPLDLAQQAQGSKYFGQYCPGGTRWLCRPSALPDSDLTFAFEVG